MSTRKFGMGWLADRINSCIRDSDLIIAICEDREEEVKLLLDRGASPNSRGKKGLTALMHACRTAQWRVAEILLEHGADPNLTTQGGWTALKITSLASEPKLVKLLLANEADVNPIVRHGISPLAMAVAVGNVEIVHLLVDGGADVNSRFKDGPTPLMLACSLGGPKEFKDLLEQMDMQPRPSIKQFSQIVRLLIEHGADVEARTHRGWTALMFACEVGRHELAKLLLDHGADPNARAKDGGNRSPGVLMESPLRCLFGVASGDFGFL